MIGANCTVSLETIRRFDVPTFVVETTDDLLRSAGDEGLEVFVLWCGVAHDEIFKVQTIHQPRQTSFKLADGLCVRVEGDALHRLNIELFDRNEVLAIQVHSHPRHAFHSETDDTYPIVTQLGGLSIVVPNFGGQGTAGEGTAVYRLGYNGWGKVSRKSAGALLRFEN